MNQHGANVTASRRRHGASSRGARPTHSDTPAARAQGIAIPGCDQAGFTALELMIVVAIVAILVGIALPSYSDYLRRGKVVEVTSVLGDGRVKLEQFFLDNLTYAGGPCPASTKAFNVSCGSGETAPTATTYTITATGISEMAGFVYTLNQSNAKTTAGPWVSGTQNCWIFKQGDTC